MNRRPLKLAAVATLLAIAGCGGAAHPGASSAPDATAGPPPEKPTITAAVVPAVDDAGFYIALDRGFFTAQGLHVKYVPAGSSADLVNKQDAGTYDVSGGNYVSYIQAQAGTLQGAPKSDLDIIGQGSTLETGGQAIYVTANSPIRSIQQLQGKTIAVNAPFGIAYLLTCSVLDQYQVNYKAETYQPVNFPDIGKALKNGSVQAAEIPQPFATQFASAMGLIKLADAQGSVQDLPIAGYVATKAWVKKYPRTLAAFQRALTEGQQVANTNRPAVEQVMEKYAGVDKVTAGVMALANFPTGINRMQLQRLPDLMQQFGLLKQPFDIGQMLG